MDDRTPTPPGSDVSGPTKYLSPSAELSAQTTRQDAAAPVSVVMSPEQAQTAAKLSAIPTFDGYEIIRELGRGGMGVVYHARQTLLGRDVALKMILPRADVPAEAIARFRAEAEAVAKLRHPNIVQVHDFGEVEGQPYFAMEFCDAGSLADLLREATLSPEQAAEWLQQLAHALHVCHSHGIIHRDLKPGNILLQVDEVSRSSRPKVTDFGLAKQTDVSLTTTGAILGTPAYMAPEQARGEEVGPAADVWALGVILYECLTGRSPFKSASVAETLRLVCDFDPITPRRLNPAVPHDLELICLKCLEKDARRRYVSTEALAKDLAAWQSGEPISVRAAGPLERLLRWAKRKPWVAAFWSMATLLLAAVIGGVLYVAEVQRQRAAEAEEAGRQITARAEAEAREAARARSAEAASEAEAARARREADVARRTTNLMSGIFEVLEPTGLTGNISRIRFEDSRKVTARELLDRGAERVLAGTKDDPLLRAALLDSIGDAYRGLGVYDKSRPLLTEALELREKHLPANHLDIAQTASRLGFLLNHQGEFEAAEALHRRVLAIHQKRPPSRETRLAVADAQLHLGWVLQMQMRSEEAEPLLRATLTTRTELLGPLHRDTTIANIGVSSMLLDTQRTAEAIPYGVQALRGLFQEFGDEGLQAVAASQAAIVAEQFGFPATAEPLYLRAIELTKPIVGKDSIFIAFLLAQCAHCKAERGKLAEAEVMLKECLEIVDRTVGLAHPRASLAVQLLFTMQYNQGKADEARATIQKAIDFAEKRPSLLKIVGFELYCCRADLNFAVGRRAEGIADAKKALTLYPGVTRLKSGAGLLGIIQQLPDEPPDFLGTQFAGIITQVMRRAKLRGLPLALNHLNARLLHRHLYDAAEPTIREAYELSRKSSTLPLVRRAAIAHYATLHRVRGEYAVAEAAYRELLKLVADKKLPPGLNDYEQLGECLAMQGKFAEAAPALDESLRQARGGPWHRWLIPARALVGCDGPRWRQLAQEAIDILCDNPWDMMVAYELLIATPSGEDVSPLLCRAWSHWHDDPHNGHARKTVAVGLLRAGRPADALTVLGPHGGDDDEMILRAIAQARTGDKESAHANFTAVRNALTAAWDRSKYRYNVGHWVGRFATQTLLAEAERELAMRKSLGNLPPP